jgi:hypothetical protein
MIGSEGQSTQTGGPQATSEGESDADVTQIMEYLRSKVVERGWESDNAWPATELDPEIRHHLVRLRELASSLHVEATPRVCRLPIVGPAIDRLRTLVHQLVVFYVASLARQQAALFFVVMRVLMALAIENRQLRDEVNRLKQGRLDAISSSEHIVTGGRQQDN